MRLLRQLRSRIIWLFRRSNAETDLNDELQDYIERQTERHVADGLSPEEARTEAARDAGGVEQLKERCRDARKVQLIETLFQDVRYGLRILRNSPGFTSVALLTLALGIGANTAIFSVVYAVLLRPLPYKEPARLVVLKETTPKVGAVGVSYPNFLDWRSQSRGFVEMASVSTVSFNMAGISQPESINGEAVSPNFLSTLGIRPYLGRDFEASEEKAGTAPVLLLSYQLWQSHFGGEHNAIGRTIALNGHGFTIIGILPPDFRSFDRTDVLEPIGVWAANNPNTAAERGERGDTLVVGRLRAGTRLASARSEMETIAARLAREYPGSNDQFGVTLQPIREIFVGDLRPAILVLSGAAIFVLLIACANVTNLFLMRAVGRAREMALRLALGAGRSRIVRQVLVESFVLAFLGGLLGLALAIAGIHGIARLIPIDILGGVSLNLNAAVLLFAAGAVILCALVFGLVPALRSAKAGVQSELKEGARATSSSRRQNRWRAALVTAEISLALILLVGAGLMIKSLYRLLSVDPGFKPDRVLTMEMSLRTAQYGKDAAILNFWTQALSRVRLIPGVEASALGTVVPLTDDHSRSDITVEGMQLVKPGNFPHPDVHIVSPGYVNTLGVQLLRGRTFTDSDNENAPQVAMINALIASRFFRHQDPVGKRIAFDRPSPTKPLKWITIVGVVAATKLYGLPNPARLEVYVPFRQFVTGDMSLLVKSGIDPVALTSSIRRAIASIDKDQPISAIATMKELVANSVATRRITLILLALFSTLALSLAMVGIYGVISYSVAERTHEIGIRVALGAKRETVLLMILAQGLKIAATGAVLGIVASFGLTRLMAKLLFSVSAADPLIFVVVTAVLVLVAMLACYIPAHRTLGVDPMIALRYE